MEIPVILETLDKAISGQQNRPKAIKVGIELWKELIKERRIIYRRGYIEGVIDSGIDLPTLDQEIFVHIDPALGDYSFDFPNAL